MKEATYVAISTQKGGAGKTTLTVLVASYLHYVKGYNVAVVDCDFPQYSIHDMRKRDMKAVMEDGHYKVLAYEQLKRLKKNPYPIRCSRAEDAVKTAENLVAAQPDLDFVFFDAESFGTTASDAAWFDYRRAKYFGTEVCDGTDLLRRMLALHCYRASACLSFIRTAYLRGLGLRFYPGILHEDELFTPQLYLGASRAGGIERAFFKRRIHGDSIMGRGFSRRNLEGYTTVLRELNRFAATRDAGQRQLIRTLTRQILRPVMRNAWALPAGTRWKLAWDALRHYPGSIDGRALATLLFKKPLKKENGK